MTLKIDRRFVKRLQARYGRFEARVGILEDRPHYAPRPAKKGLGTLQGGPVRKKNRTKVKGTVAQVSEAIRKEHQVPYLTAPFDKTRSKDMREMRKALGDLVTGKTRSYSKLETRLRRVIRNPILRKAYGRNTDFWARVKTFNRFLIDTGQFYRAITAKVRVKRRNV